MSTSRCPARRLRADCVGGCAAFRRFAPTPSALGLAASPPERFALAAPRANAFGAGICSFGAWALRASGWRLRRLSKKKLKFNFSNSKPIWNFLKFKIQNFLISILKFRKNLNQNLKFKNNSKKFFFFNSKKHSTLKNQCKINHSDISETTKNHHLTAVFRGANLVTNLQATFYKILIYKGFLCFIRFGEKVSKTIVECLWIRRNDGWLVLFL